MAEAPGPTFPSLPRTDLLTKVPPRYSLLSVLTPALLPQEELIPLFGAANYSVFAAMLLVSAAIGVFFWWRSRGGTEEFLLGGRSMGTLPMTLSLVARCD